MTQYAAGSITSGKDGCLYIRIWGEPHYIYPEELGRLIFMGDCVPLLRHQPTSTDPPQVSGTVHMNMSGRGIVIEIGNTHYQLPRDRFLAVALGEEISCIFFEVPDGRNEPAVISPGKGRVS
jgi:hypothetical protein